MRKSKFFKFIKEAYSKNNINWSTKEFFVSFCFFFLWFPSMSYIGSYLEINYYLLQFVLIPITAALMSVLVVHLYRKL